MMYKMCHTQLSATHREMQTDSEARVWPCCMLMNMWRYRPNGDYPKSVSDQQLTQAAQAAFENTEEWRRAEAEDPNWNSLKHHTWEEIMAHPMYSRVWWWENLNGDDPKPCAVCNHICGAEDSPVRVLNNI